MTETGAEDRQAARADAGVPRPVRLDDLPPPPAGRTGWPWTEESPAVEWTADELAALPRISIVTPSFNQGRYLEATIRSVLLQGYPRLEYVVMDGGSTDESVEVIRRYERWIDAWVSERDRGQTHAIRKGLARCSGEVFNWINSDDQLAPGALAEVGRRFAAERFHLLTGRGLVVSGDGAVVHDWHARVPSDPTAFLRDYGVVMSQPSTFFSTAALEEIGGLREDLHYVMDWEAYLRFALLLRDRLRAATTPVLLSYSLSHEDAKTSRASSEFAREAQRILAESRPHWRPEEWRKVARVLQRREIERRVAEAQAAEPPDLGMLARLPFRAPRAVLSRLYWGGVRRVIRHRFR